MPTPRPRPHRVATSRAGHRGGRDRTERRRRDGRRDHAGLGHGKHQLDEITGGDPEILQVLAVVDQSEVQDGQLAQQKARNAQVKSFARDSSPITRSRFSRIDRSRRRRTSTSPAS